MGDTGLPDIFLIDGTEIKDALFIAETFNSYFTNLGGLDQHWQKKSSFPPACSFALLSTSFWEVIQISSLLKNSTSPGINGINPSIARSSISLVATHLS